MIAKFYIISESFISNTQQTKEELELKIERLGEDYIYIRQYNDRNSMFVNYNIYDVILINGSTIADLLYTNPNYLERDARNALRNIIEMSKQTDYTIDDINRILIEENNENMCLGVIAFNQINRIAEVYQIIYDRDGWFKFRRYYLGKYPRNAQYFIDECSLYFPNLFFHEHNKDSIKPILAECRVKVLEHLAALNDKFGEIHKREIGKNTNRQRILDVFSAEVKLDENASLEGNAARKKEFTFKFVDNCNSLVDVCCEPHLKLPYNDLQDGSYSTNRRIHFHEGKTNIANGNILIGHIGKHL